MIREEATAVLAQAAVITALAASLWCAAPVVGAVAGESDPAIASDEHPRDRADDQTLEIPSVGAVYSFHQEGLGDAADYESEQTVMQMPVMPAGQHPHDGSDSDFERGAMRLGITVEDGVFEREGVEGVMITKVIANSPGARAGLVSRRATLQRVFEGVAVAGCLFFPPAFMIVPVVEEAEIGTSYDLIIGVDGERIHDAMELDDSLEKAEPGEIVYLSVMRGPRRLQIPVALPRGPAPTQPK